MCLTIKKHKILPEKQLHFKKSRKNINCYKILIINDDGTYITPFQRFPIEFDKLYTNTEKLRVEDYENEFNVFEGVFHSFSRRYFANVALHVLVAEIKLGFIKDSILTKNTRFQIINAIIPKGTEYLTGNNNDYGSKKIIYKID